MDTYSETPKKRSLGKLRRNVKTKDRSPDLIGQLRLQRHLFKELARQFAEQEESDELIINIAAWANRDADGDYLTTEISPYYVSRRSDVRPPERSNLRHFFGGAGDSESNQD
jgi:hypothetical protein